MSLATPEVDEAVDTLQDEAARRLLDMLIPPACEWQTVDMPEICGAPATWLLGFSCGHSFYYDDAHKAGLDAILTEPGPLFCGCPVPHIHKGLKQVDYAWSAIS